MNAAKIANPVPVTLQTPPDLHRHAKSAAAMTGQTLQGLILNALAAHPAVRNAALAVAQIDARAQTSHLRKVAKIASKMAAASPVIARAVHNDPLPEGVTPEQELKELASELCKEAGIDTAERKGNQ